MKRLSEEFSKSEDNKQVEEMIWDSKVTVDKGFYLELYGNPEGKNSDIPEGSSSFVYIDEELTYGELLSIFSDLGSVKDDTLTINIVGEFGKQERVFCKENPISRYK